MVPQAADVCMYVFVCGLVRDTFCHCKHFSLVTHRYWRGIICVTWFVVLGLRLSVCLSVWDGGRGACNSKCHRDWLSEPQFGTAGLYLQILGGLLMALVLQLTCF